jgi:hypothetical protein
MCGRQAGDGEQYMETLRRNPGQTFDIEDGLRYNVPPGTRPIALLWLGK